MHMLRTPAEQHVAMTWAQRLKRVFGIDMQTCGCGGTIKAIACIEDPSVIKRILDHLRSARNEISANVLT